MSTFKGLVVGHLGDVTLRRIRQNHFCREKGISITYFSVCVCARAQVSACVCMRAVMWAWFPGRRRVLLRV